MTPGYNNFVLPFMFGMVFVLGYCLFGFFRIMAELSARERRHFFASLFNPKTAWKNIRDIFLNCLFHVKLWKKNKTLGFMHSSIAFGWFMLIVLGHVEVWLFAREGMGRLYYPIFFNYFVAEEEATIGGAFIFFLMDFFLLLVLAGITLAIIKRFRSRWFGMRRTTRPSVLDIVGLYSLWAIFPLRLLAEGMTAHISGGSFLIIPLNWVARQFLGNELNMLPTWWAYSIALGVFMTVLPFTRYMHIPTEILLIPMRNAGLCIRNARKGFAKVQVYSCPGCGVCIDACPMTVKKANLKDTTVYLNRQIRRGNEKRIEEISDKCLLCGKCTAVCQVGVDGPAMRIAQRALRKYNIREDYGSFDIAPLKAAAAEGSAKVAYFAGCMTQLTPGISASVERLLQASGTEYTFLDRDGGLCCGRPLVMAGKMEEAASLIRLNKEIIRASEADVLLLSCPICYRVFKEQYDLGGIRVVHHSVYFNELLQKGALSLAGDGGRFVFHDPCELGRGSGIYEEPRQVLGRAGELVEAAQHHAQSICCGGSLGSITLGFSDRKEMTENALRNLMENGPDTIVTACPLCRSTFRRYSDTPVKLNFMDINENDYATVVITLDRDSTYQYKDADGNWRTIENQELVDKIYKEKFYQESTGGFRSGTDDAPISLKEKIESRYGQKMDQTIIQNELSHPESYGTDVKKMLGKEHAAALDDATQVSKAVEFKGLERFERGRKMLLDAEKIADPLEKVAKQADAIGELMEGCRQEVKIFDQFTIPRDLARANINGGSQVSPRLKKAIEVARNFEPGTKLEDVEAALDRLGYTLESFAKDMGDTMFRIG